MRLIIACSVSLCLPMVARADAGESENRVTANFDGGQVLKGAFVGHDAVKLDSARGFKPGAEFLTVYEEAEVSAELGVELGGGLSIVSGLIVHVFTEEPVSMSQEVYAALAAEFGLMSLMAGVFADTSALGEAVIKVGPSVETELWDTFTLEGAATLALAPTSGSRLALAETEIVVALGAPVVENIAASVGVAYVHDHASERGRLTVSLNAASTF